LIQPPDHPRAHLRRREQILTSLPSGIEPGYRLIQIRASPPHQPSCRHQLDKRFPRWRTHLRGLASCRSQCDLGGERSPGKPSPASGFVQFGQLLVGEKELH
jgi:hypothetical protein